MFRLRLFGGVSLEGGRTALTGKAAQRHRLALLALLAVAGPRGSSRDKLAGYLWPESDARHARNLLSQAVHALRQVLGAESIVSTGDDLRLNPDIVTPDVAEFEEALAAGERARAVELYAGPLLDGFFLGGSPEFERWLDAERDRLRRAYLEALEALAVEAAARGDRAGAVAWWRRSVTEEPYSARATLGLMEALAAVGDRAEALSQARLHARILREEFDAEPNAEVTALADRIRMDPSGPVLPVSAAAAAADGAPQQTPALGGADEAGAVPNRGRSRTRAVGLTAAALVLLGIVGWAVLDAPQRESREISRIAVLPLANLMGDPQQDYFVAGMHEALIAELSQIAALTVLSRQSVLRYQGSDQPLDVITRELGVDALVEGSVFRAGDSIRITVQLLRGSPEEHLWSQVYRHALRDALGLHSEVARAIARAVHATVGPEEQTRLARARPADPRAQEAYLKGLYHLESGLLEIGGSAGERTAEALTAIRHLEEAVALDGEWAAAHAGLAGAYHWLASSFQDTHAAEYYPKSKAAALRALQLDDTESRAHASLGFVLYRHDWDWAGAERAFRRALQLDPNSHHWLYALYLQAAGRYDEAIAHFRQAEARNPLSEVLKRQVALVYGCADRQDEVIAQLRELEARVDARQRPDQAAQVAWDLALAYLRNSMYEEALAEYDRAAALSARYEPGLAQIAYVHARAGRLDEARELVARLEEETGGAFGWPAHLFAALGDTDRALAMVEELFEERPTIFVGFHCTDTYRLLAHEPRMQAIMRRIGYPD